MKLAWILFKPLYHVLFRVVSFCPGFALLSIAKPHNFFNRESFDPFVQKDVIKRETL